MFKYSEQFFDLPDNFKVTVPWSAKNVGWEKNPQIRPSAGTADMKESYQLQFGENMKDSWISEAELPNFKDTALNFMRRAQSVSERLMLCFARGLGFADDYFIKAHDVSKLDSQTTLRLLHYFAVDKTVRVPEDHFRAGAHADWDFLTLLFQRPGQSGLEICPGREVVSDFGIGDEWAKSILRPVISSAISATCSCRGPMIDLSPRSTVCAHPRILRRITMDRDTISRSSTSLVVAAQFKDH